jgi:uncharacterized protein
MTNEWQDAVQRGSIDQLQRLLNGGCDIDALDRYGQTALMIAAGKGNADVVGWLIEHGASLNHTAKYCLSALMLAVVRSHIDVVRRLADAGADISLCGSGAPQFAGKTALDLAIALGHTRMVEICRTVRTRSSPRSESGVDRGPG